MRPHLESVTVALGGLVALLGGVVLTAAPASGVDVPIPLRVYLNKLGSKTKFVAKGTFALPAPAVDDPTAEGGQITFSAGVASETISLPAQNWSALGNPPGAKGFKYSDPSGATCKKILVKGSTIKGLCKATAAAAPPYDAGSDAPLSIVLSIGTATQRYCAECPNGGEQKGNPSRVTKLTDCAAPASCPIPPPMCGNNDVEGTEECDGTDALACPGACTAGCTCPVCGNNAVEGAEECDGSDAPACPGVCTAACTCPVCGNNDVEGTEECDGSDAIACPGFCTGGCTCSTDPECCTVPFMSMPPYICIQTPPMSCVFSGGTPMADGVCNLLSGSCHDPNSCGGSGPACDGPCPAGGTCTTFLGSCICSAGPCGAFPACDGACPAEYFCGELPFTGVCTCAGF